MYARGHASRRRRASPARSPSAPTVYASSARRATARPARAASAARSAGGEVLKTFPDIEDQVALRLHRQPVLRRPGRTATRTATAAAQRRLVPGAHAPAWALRRTAATLTDARDPRPSCCHERYTPRAAATSTERRSSLDWCAAGRRRSFAAVEAGGSPAPTSTWAPDRPAGGAGVTPAPYEVLVVGGGPPARRPATGWPRTATTCCVVERKTLPPREDLRRRPHAAGGAASSHDMGLGDAARRAFHRYDGLRARPTAGRSSCAWPEHPVFPTYGYVVRRRDLDQMVADNAVEAGRHPAAGHRGARARDRAGLRRAAPSSSRKARPTPERDPGPLRRRRRRRQQPLRAGARHVPQPGVAVRHGHPQLLGEPAPRRAVDRVARST